MSRERSGAKVEDPDGSHLKVREPEDHAAGVKAVLVAARHALPRAGVVRTMRSWLRLNQVDGFDCMSCAWPDPDPEHRHTAEFCENGAKAVAEETDRRKADAAFFAAHSISDLDGQSEWWLGQQGRLTEPMVRRPGSDHYTPISWDAAFRLMADELNSLASPDEAVFYTSGRASNEAAFAYQLFSRAYGTNNLPDCSNMCHESTSVALAESIGIGKASVSMRDVYDAELIVIAGQNPGTNHPRMLSALEIAKRRGAKIVAINPLREAGLINFRNPQQIGGIIGRGVDIADDYLQIKINGDLALFQAVGSLLVEWDALDHEFIEAHATGFADWAAHVAQVDRELVVEATGLSWQQIVGFAERLRASKGTVWCWAMGITQHRNGVATIKEITNLALARGDIGKRGAGLLPVRGHSNVQGDRTMGIWERPPAQFLDSLQAEFGFDPPREHGLDTVEAIRSMRDGKAHVFIGLAGNFLQAAPDTDVTSEALGNCSLTVHISTKLNRSHLHTGRTALILPTLGRTERDVRGGKEQFVTVEDSVCAVHASRGRLEPASKDLMSETAIICGLAEATLGDKYGIRWSAMADDYDVVRDHISRVVAGCENYTERVDRPGGFVMPHPPRDSRTFKTESGFAEFAVSPIELLQVPDGCLLLQTMRSHDQFNTTIYGHDDRYRGIHNGRRVVFLHREDIATAGFHNGDHVDLIGHWDGDDVERVAADFRIVEYDTPRGSAAAYYPETNPLVPLDSTAVGSNTPTSKAVVISLRPVQAAAPVAPGAGRPGVDEDGQDDVGADEGHKRFPQPEHLS
ncbi:MAG: FdhF/YdeP family oxidoreductase [Nakamurella sp.]